MADMKPYCRALSDWEVEQAYVDWDGGAGRAISVLAKEAGTTPKTLERAFRRLEERRDGTEPDEPAPRPAAEAAPCSLALVRTMPDGGSYRLELGMRSDALKLFTEIAAKVMACPSR